MEKNAETEKRLRPDGNGAFFSTFNLVLYRARWTLPERKHRVQA